MAEPQTTPIRASYLRQIFREPLVHFLLAGSAVFLFSSWRDEPVDPASRTIIVSAEQVSRLVSNWQQIWHRAPTSAEIDGLIRDHIKEEVYYREAKRLALDEDDVLIRRRLRSKMEYLATAAVENMSPDDSTLQQWLDKNPVRYLADARFSFDQVYLAENDPTKANRKAEALRVTLSRGGDWTKLGDPVSLPHSFEKVTKSDIAAEFGDEFAPALEKSKPAVWIGPIKSGVGFHLIRLRAVTTVDAPKLNEVRQDVENDWRAATIKDRETRAYQALLDGYTIKIEKP